MRRNRYALASFHSNSSYKVLTDKKIGLSFVYILYNPFVNCLFSCSSGDSRKIVSAPCDFDQYIEFYYK